MGWEKTVDEPTDGSYNGAEQIDCVVMTGERPPQMPTQPPRRFAAVIYPRDYSPSAPKATWLFTVDQVPPEITELLRPGVLQALIKVINRETVESRVFMAAEPQCPDPIQWVPALGRRGIHILAAFGFVFTLFLVLTIAGALPGPVGGVAFSGLLDTLIVVGYAVAHTVLDEHARKIVSRVLMGYVFFCVFLVAHIPFWIFVDDTVISLGTIMGAQYSLIPFGIAVGIGAAQISNRPSSVRGSAGRAAAGEAEKDPVAATDPVLVKGPEFWQGPFSVPEGMGKLMRPEGRDTAVYATKLMGSEGVAKEWAHERLLLALLYFQERLMANFPELRCNLEVTSCQVRKQEGAGDVWVKQSFPLLVITRGYNHELIAPVRSGMQPLQEKLARRPMTALVHHLSQPDPATGEVYLPAEEVEPWRRAFYARHPDPNADPTVPIPPMGRAVEELLQQQQQPLGSSAAGVGGGGGYPGAGGASPNLWGSTGAPQGMPPTKKDLPPDSDEPGVEMAPHPATVV